jgi:hypothetical protein
MPPTDAHPVSAALEAFLLAELSRHAIVVWLDRDDNYSAFVDALAARTEPRPFAAPIVAHRGSYLESMIALEAHTSSVDASPLLLHVPFATEDSLRASPLLEVRAIAFPFRKSLDTLIREAAAGRVPPAEVDRFLADGPTTLESADAWMATKVAAASGELAAMLCAVAPSALHDDLRSAGRIATRLRATNEHGPIWHYLAANLGLRDDWALPAPRELAPPPTDVADALAAWALCVEYVHDLRRSTQAPALAGLELLARPLVEACREVAQGFRATAPDAYARLALEVERLIPVERTAGTAADLGRIDTFRFEEEQLFAAALDSLHHGRFDEAHAWAQDRLKGKSFWLDHDPTRKSAWVLVRGAAELGLAVARCPLDYRRATSLGEAAELYAEHGAAVDRLHRRLEQSIEARIHRRVPSYEALRAALDQTRAAYRQWADTMARAFSDLCEREGALPSSDYQQRRIFDDVVRPLLDDGEKTALFLVDGLRFEMAQELLEQLGKPTASAVHLRPRLAELPSVTEVGMNVLAPVADGSKLRPLLDKKARRFEGFQTAGFRVDSADHRKKAMARRAGGATCPAYDLPVLLAMSDREIRDGLRQARLVIIESGEIDGAGEKGTGLPVFAGAIRKLHKAWRLLRDAGVQRFVITSDHGFLLRHVDDPTLVHGQGYDALPRYAVYPKNVPSSDQLGVSLRSLEYEDTEDCLLLPRGLEVYQRGKDRNYVHGGNSPQERVIPVLTLVHKRAPGSDDLRYVVTIEQTGTPSGMCSIHARIESAAGQTGLSFAEAAQIDLDLRVVGDDAVDLHLVEARGGARLDGDVAQVQVGTSFELLFRLTGATEARVPVELFHPSGTYAVEGRRTEARFGVEATPPARPTAPPEPAATATATKPAPAPLPPAVADAGSWLLTYDDPGIRRVFAHIEKHLAINEPEVIAMLGSPRAMRKFSLQFEALAERAPFVVRIDFAAGTKRYVKESKRHE